MKHFQFLLKETETDLFHTLRSIEEKGAPPTGDEVYKPGQTLDLLVFAGDRDLGRHFVDGNNLILEFAKIGAEIRDTILRGDSDKEATHDVNGDSADERDSVLDADCNGLDDEPISWKDVREEVIPSYVRGVTFAIAEADITPSRRRELEERFPGVVISSTPVPAEVGKPKGIKSATFELDRTDPALETSISNQFPWVTIRSDPVGNTSSSESLVSAAATEAYVQSSDTVSSHAEGSPLAADLAPKSSGPVVWRESVNTSNEATITSPGPMTIKPRTILREDPNVRFE
ncbi:hypothetical protein BU26DRAFT_599963 [Trematosphaeria pertusa]|uniref:Uncharacterized protein n=1 Tax=Trematosphaeria pertusa TaxID=390896 RepID=A0A6A6IW32_9PLEO|nr:uncharacterized protein BU26DRAFT_599963 [Trematosphaeria pertusa]KAF2254142.1 hypothetical protein BU26DRAFT_599963 [Trematosphaeria pertusa]